VKVSGGNTKSVRMNLKIWNFFVRMKLF